MKVLVACEFSGIVRDAFIARGHEAMSCDLLPTETPGPHYQGDVLDIVRDGWDLMIAHPPCTFIARNGARWEQPEEKSREGREFFLSLLNAPVQKICIENPIPRKSAGLPQCSQVIQPWFFGHDYSKKTCLWLKGLPPLMSTGLTQISYYITPKGRKFTAGWYRTPRNGKDRSRTFPGIAVAMAEQWGNSPNE